MNLNYYNIKLPKFSSPKDQEYFFNRIGVVCYDYKSADPDGILAYVQDHKLEKLYALCLEYETTYEIVEPPKQKKKVKFAFDNDIGFATAVPAENPVVELFNTLDE